MHMTSIQYRHTVIYSKGCPRYIDVMKGRMMLALLGKGPKAGDLAAAEAVICAEDAEMQRA